MIDFNDETHPLAPENRETERNEIRAELIARLPAVLVTLFPAGKKRQGKFLVGDVLGSPGDSLEVVLDGEKAGLWTDRATGDGGDIFDLIACHLALSIHTDFHRVLDAAADLLGRSRSAPVRTGKKPSAPVDELGPATAKWDYFDATGKLIAVVYRYDPPGQKKQYRPWDAKRHKMAPPDPRPLYNQPGMVSDAQVVLVEGEKCAQALIEAGIVATTAMHGANAPVDKTDWSPLSGKAVLIWPDRDKPGWNYAAQAAQAILSAGAKSCHILYPPEEAAEGWDAADAIAEGFDVATFLTHGPRLQMHDVADEVDPVVSSDESVWGTEDALALSFTFVETRGDRHPTDLAGLRGARFVTAIETEQGRRLNESKVKAITGGDKISARFMRQDFFEYTPQFKPVIVGNHKPAIRNIDEAMKRRMHMIPFTVTIPPERRDSRLTEKLLSERDGILAWAVAGCLAWQREGLKPPASVVSATEEYFEAEDALGRWLEERCVRAPNAKSLTAELFSDWKQWAETSGEFIGSQRRFSDLLITRGLEKWRNSVGVRGFQGIGLKHPPMPAYTPYADN